MDKAIRILIPSEVRNLVFSAKDCHVAPLLAATVLEESLNSGLTNFYFCGNVMLKYIESLIMINQHLEKGEINGYSKFWQHREGSLHC
jgi:hypothetical protein